MRLAAAFILAACYTASAREGHLSSVAIILDVDSVDSTILSEMRREVQQILAPTGLRVEVQLRREIDPDNSFDDLMVVAIKGDCGALPDPMLMDERGPQPLAYAHSESGRIQPFAVVGCEPVRRAVDAALWGGQRKQRNELIGRALGRVVTHEVVHMLAKTPAHGRSGVFRSSLSGADLIAERMRLDPKDVGRLFPSKPDRQQK